MSNLKLLDKYEKKIKFIHGHMEKYLKLKIIKLKIMLHFKELIF